MSFIIDSHCHIYPEKIADKAVDAIGRFYDIPMGYTGRADNLIEVGKRDGVGRFIIFSVATSPHQVSSINRFIHSEVEEHPECFTGLGTMHPDSENKEEEFKEVLSLGLKGIKLHPDFQKFAVDEERCRDICSLCVGKMPVLFHAGDYRYDFSNPNRMKVLVEAFPDLIIIGAHFGGYSVWESATEELYKYENFYVDCSSSFFAMDENLGKKLIRKYGADRVLFASDYPMWSPGDNIKVLEKMKLTDDEYEKIYNLNAKRVFGL